MDFDFDSIPNVVFKRSGSMGRYAIRVGDTDFCFHSRGRAGLLCYLGPENSAHWARRLIITGKEDIMEIIDDPETMDILSIGFQDAF